MMNLFTIAADIFQGFHHETIMEWVPDGIFHEGVSAEWNGEPIYFVGAKGRFERRVYKIYGAGGRVLESSDYDDTPLPGFSRGPRELTRRHYYPLAVAELRREREERAQEADQVGFVIKHLLDTKQAGVVASVANTFDNGYTSVWNYRVGADGSLFVQKPWGNKARATFDSINDLIDDLTRYLGYGFEMT